MTGTFFNDTLIGLGGDDLFSGQEGDDLIDGGAGADTAYYFFNTSTLPVSSLGVTVDLALGTARGVHGNDTLKSIENVVGTEVRDTIRGSQAANRLRGGRGDDLLDGGKGDDILDGGSGIDTVSYERCAKGVNVSLVTGRTLAGDRDTLIAIENVLGSAANDVLNGDLAANHLQGNAGNDTLRGGEGNDILIGCNPRTGRGRGEVDVLDGGVGADTYILADHRGLLYDDGVNNASTETVQPRRFGLARRTSEAGWRNPDSGSRLHAGIDFAGRTPGVPADYTAGVSGVVTRAGFGDNNIISVRLDNTNNVVEYLHSSRVYVRVGQRVSATTRLGRTGSRGSKEVHLHVQVKDSAGQVIDPNRALLNLSNSPLSQWCQGIGDYAVIRSFNPSEDKIQLSGSATRYRMLPIGATDSERIGCPVGTAIIADNDGIAGFSRNDEMIALIQGSPVTSFARGFVFV